MLAIEKSAGHLIKNGQRQIAIRMSDDLFMELKMAAIKEHRSLSAQIVVFIERGLAKASAGQ